MSIGVGSYVKCVDEDDLGNVLSLGKRYEVIAVHNEYNPPLISLKGFASNNMFRLNRFTLITYNEFSKLEVGEQAVTIFPAKSSPSILEFSKTKGILEVIINRGIYYDKELGKWDTCVSGEDRDGEVEYINGAWYMYNELGGGK